MTGLRKISLLVMTGAALSMAVVGCGSSSHSTSGGSTAPTTVHGSSATGTYTIGLLTDVTGLLSNSDATSVNGVKAAVGMFNATGYHLKYVVADTTSSPTGALTAAKKLVEQDHVFAVDLISGVGFAADQYLTSTGTPVIGADIDGGTAWTTARNFFSAYGTPNFDQVETTTGDLLKLLGAKNFGAIGYSISPSSSKTAKASALSAQEAGIKVGYLNTQFPFGSTNVGPAVIAMKNAGVDSFTAAVEQTTSLAILSGLHQQGVHLTAPLLTVGYNDLTGPATEAVAKGAYFTHTMEPIELHTTATEQLANAMQTYANIASNQIDLSSYLGYMSVDSLATGLMQAGGHSSQAQFIDAMLGIRSWNGAGLYGSHTIGFALDQRGHGTAGADNCLWVLQWDGSSYHLVQGALPLCGTVIPGKTV
jgi:branched-chain amino acid transport system substrate-binding protein